MDIMERNKYYYYRSVFSIWLGIIASLFMFYGLYLLLTGTASATNHVSDMLLIFSVLILGSVVSTSIRSPFEPEIYSVRFLIYNILFLIASGAVGFQILTDAVRDVRFIKVCSSIICIYNIFYLLFQCNSFRHLKKPI